MSAGAPITRAKAIRRYCVGCVGGVLVDVRQCELSEGCSLWRYRMGREMSSAPATRLTRGRAIRAFCVSCMGDQPHLVASCPSASTCALYGYRMGRACIADVQNRACSHVLEPSPPVRTESDPRVLTGS